MRHYVWFRALFLQLFTDKKPIIKVRRFVTDGEVCHNSVNLFNLCCTLIAYSCLLPFRGPLYSPLSAGVCSIISSKMDNSYNICFRSVKCKISLRLKEKCSALQRWTTIGCLGQRYAKRLRTCFSCWETELKIWNCLWYYVLCIFCNKAISYSCDILPKDFDYRTCDNFVYEAAFDQ